MAASLPVLSRHRKVVPVSLQQSLVDLFIVAVIAALTPIVAGLLSRLRVPQVVILIVGGVLVGPQVLAWADPAGIELVSNVGLGFLFLLAGYELELGLFRERAGRLALTSWFVTLVDCGRRDRALAAVGFVNAFVPIAIGLTTTALGTLLPILRDNQMLEGRFGAFIMAAGAVGEFLPIVADRDLPQRQRCVPRPGLPGHHRARSRCCSPSSRGWSGTRRSGGSSPKVSTRRRRPPSGGPCSCCFALLVIAADFGLDVVLGAFLAGVVLRRWAPGDVHALEAKLDAVGYGFFIPVFFVCSGMSLDLRSIARVTGAPGRLLRPLPRRPWPPRPAVLSARPAHAWTGSADAAHRDRAVRCSSRWPTIGLEAGTMLPENAAALVGAGVLSVIVFPAVAVSLGRSGARPLVETPAHDRS